VCTEHGDTLIGNFLDQAGAFRPRVHRVAARARPVGSQGRPESKSPPGAAAAGAALQLRYRQLAWRVDPEAAFVHLFGDQRNAFWLGSDLVETERCRFVYMGAADGPHSQVLRYDVAQRKLTLETPAGRRVIDESVFTYLSRELAARRCQTTDLPFDFNCGFAGYFGYELKAECGGTLVHRSAVPDAALIFADRLIAFDRLQHRCYALALASKGEVEACEAWFDTVERALAAAPAVPGWSPRAACTPVRQFSLSRSDQTYLDDVGRCLSEIRAGESYEICLTNQLHTGPVSCPLDFYRVLRRSNPAPYACYLRFGDVAVVSSSPEQFLKVAPDGRLSTRPIKGTTARAADGQADAAACAGLTSNAKDRAENLIVVDLLRNDLGRVCEVGSVQVARLMEIETYATVHQLVSTIEGRLGPGKTAVDALRSAFPGGSMTGAPKKRTLEIIDRLETEARGVYSGAAGFFALNGGADLSIVIRTAVCTTEGTSIGAGGGITTLSNPEAELGEMLLKARALIDALVEVDGGTAAAHDHQVSGAAPGCERRVRETTACRR
jgi:para-aminobenzoate synthetase